MHEVYKQIEESMENVEVPESLSPENIKKKLMENNKRKQNFKRHIMEIAAAVALVIIAGGTGIYVKSANKVTEQKALTAGQDTQVVEVANGKKETVGAYHLAKSYDEIYDSIAKSEYINESGEKEFVAETVEDTATSNQKEYSTTNLQVEGVDESDFVKCDGKYLFVQTDEKVSIIDIQSKSMKTVATVKPNLASDSEILDIYMDKNRLYLVIQERDVQIRDDDISEDIQYIDASSNVILQTYDITGRAGGKLLGTVRMDGQYQTSRKVGEYIYLFTEKYFYDSTEKNKQEAVPEINNEKIACSDVYIQENATNEYIVASVNVNNPSETVDQMVLLNADMQIYMGTESIYLYAGNYDWNNEKSYTDIAKFSYKDGKMNAVNATSVQGTIGDQFAISESDGVLRVLTTDWTRPKSENRLYLMDENLKTLGKLENIATGEEIYAARYIGYIAYFITYHNTDPLFAVDISDPEKPKMLGQVEMTGFSDYLHPYGENLLLGIGYETDPDTSMTEGVKITMFDISDPTELKIMDSVKIEGDRCNAADDYKCALVDEDKNMIGFAVSDYGQEKESMKYYLYQWKKDHFDRLLVENLENNYLDLDTNIRGLYAGNQFYIIYQTENGYEIISYDMENNYERTDKLKIS